MEDIKKEAEKTTEELNKTDEKAAKEADKAKIRAEKEQEDEKKVDVIKYDYQIMDDAWWLLNENGYEMVKR